VVVKVAKTARTKRLVKPPVPVPVVTAPGKEADQERIHQPWCVNIYVHHLVD